MSDLKKRRSAGWEIGTWMPQLCLKVTEHSDLSTRASSIHEQLIKKKIPSNMGSSYTSKKKQNTLVRTSTSIFKINNQLKLVILCFLVRQTFLSPSRFFLFTHGLIGEEEGGVVQGITAPGQAPVYQLCSCNVAHSFHNPFSAPKQAWQQRGHSARM